MFKAELISDRCINRNYSKGNEEGKRKNIKRRGKT
jgi:hypothetical protein